MLSWNKDILNYVTYVLTARVSYINIFRLRFNCLTVGLTGLKARIRAGLGMIFSPLPLPQQMSHLSFQGLALALSVPVFVVVTKIDMCPGNVLQETLKLLVRTLRNIINKLVNYITAQGFVSAISFLILVRSWQRQLGWVESCNELNKK